MSDTIQQGSKDFLLSNAAYDLLNRIALIILPAIGTFYFGLSAIWGLPYGEQVVGTCTAAALFVGALVKLSNRSYSNSDNKYDGEVVVVESSPASVTYDFQTTASLEDLATKKELIFKVQPPA